MDYAIISCLHNGLGKNVAILALLQNISDLNITKNLWFSMRMSMLNISARHSFWHISPRYEMKDISK